MAGVTPFGQELGWWLEISFYYEITIASAGRYLRIDFIIFMLLFFFTMNPYIIYSLSKDRTTQKFNKNNPSQIIEDIQLFLSTYSTTNSPNSVTLTIYTNDIEFEGILAEIFNRATQKFGSSEKSPISYHYPNGLPNAINKNVWELPIDLLPKAMQFISDISPMPKTTFGPVELFITYSFKLIDLKTGFEFQNQYHNSIFSIWLSRNNAISPTIFFPFATPDINFWNYIDTIANKLPFKLEEKQLKLANANPKGQVKSFKKIARP